MHPGVKSVEPLKNSWKFLGEDITSRLEWDEINPRYVFATTWIYCDRKYFNIFKRLYNKENKSRIYIFSGDEALYPDLNIFDYATTYNCNLRYSDRVCRIPPAGHFGTLGKTNDMIYEAALNKAKNNNLKFCNFIYSNYTAHPVRDQLFYKISEYKKVDSLGRHLNNTNTIDTRDNSDWQNISVKLKSRYKFTIAAENALFNGYTSEKLLTSFQAHSVPIYFGNPQVAEEYNPEAFINFHDYKTFEDLIARIKEIDENDELWAKMVSAPWQTEAQIADCENKMQNYYNFMKNIFAPSYSYQEINNKKRTPFGSWAKYYCSWYFDRIYYQNTIKMKFKKIGHRILKIFGLRG